MLKAMIEIGDDRASLPSFKLLANKASPHEGKMPTLREVDELLHLKRVNRFPVLIC